MRGWGVRWLLNGLLLAGALLSAGNPQAPAADFSADFSAVLASGPPSWGSNLWWTDQDVAVWTGRWEELGLVLARVPVPHALVEPVNDNGDPYQANPEGFLLDTPIGFPALVTRTLTYRNWFEALRDRSPVEMMVSFTYLAPWLTDNPPHEGYSFLAAPYPPNDLDEYREFVEVLLRYLVEELGFPPERLLLEAVNEPDLGCGQDPAVPCFWRDWTMQDIADVVRVTCEAVQETSPAVRVVGLAECCGTGVVRALLDGYAEGSCLTDLSYHYYSNGYDLDAVMIRKTELAPYDRPLYLDEYGDFEYLSVGTDGGLWHSWALPVLWTAGVIPAQYPISEFPLHPEPYNSMGLFEDWRGDWERKPAYWVYANFFHHITGGEVISATAPPTIDILAVRRLTGEEAEVALWVVNRTDVPLADQSFAVYNFPGQEAVLHEYDNLIGPAPILTTTIAGSPLAFAATLPARSSLTIWISKTNWATARLHLPVVLREAGP